MKKLSRKIFSHLPLSLVFGFFLSAFVLWPFLPSAHAATCSLTLSPASLSITAGDTDGVYASGWASSVNTTGGPGVARNSTLSASSGNSAIVAVLAPISVSSSGNGATNTFKLSAKSTGSTIVAISYSFSVTRYGSIVESCSKSVEINVSVSPFSPNPQNLVGSDANTWRIISGTVSSGGTKVAGSDFVVAKISGGQYSIAYVGSFYQNPPTLLVSPAAAGLYYISTANETTSGARVYTWKRTIDGAGHAGDSAFSFIAIGRRSSNTSCSFERGGSDQLQVIRGRFYWSGTNMIIDEGRGFYVDRTGGGVYRATFLSPFKSMPSVVAMDASGYFRMISTSGAAADSFTVSSFNNFGDSVETAISFIAIGPSTLSTSCPVHSIEQNPLKLAYGRIASFGNLVSGSGAGFSSTRTGTGTYTINYSATNPFVSNPSPMASLDDGVQGVITVYGSFSTGATSFLAFNQSSGEHGGTVNQANRAFAVISAGPVAAPPSCTSAGTIKVNSLNVVSSQPVQSSWIFSAVPSTNPCSVNTCTSSTAQTYPSMPAGTPPLCLYTLTPIPYSAGPLLSLKGVEKQFAAGEWRNDVFAPGFWKNLLAKVAEAVVVGPCTGSYCTLSLDAGGTVVFNIKWNPEASIGVSPNPLSLQGDNPSGVINVSNNGANGSTLANLYYAGNPVYTGPSGWLVTSTLPTVPINYGDLAQPVTISANTSGFPLGSCQTAGSCVATITLRGTSLPSGLNITPGVSVRINLMLSAPQTSCNSFTASPTTIIPPQPTTLSWDCTGLSGCGITSDVGPDIGPVASVGSTNISPASSTVYTLACTNTAGGGSITPLPLQVDVTVNAPGTIEIPP